jgi:hypothetical protein
MRTIKEPMKRKEYEKELRTLQVELCTLRTGSGTTTHAWL